MAIMVLFEIIPYTVTPVLPTYLSNCRLNIRMTTLDATSVRKLGTPLFIIDTARETDTFEIIKRIVFTLLRKCVSRIAMVTLFPMTVAIDAPASPYPSGK